MDPHPGKSERTQLPPSDVASITWGRMSRRSSSASASRMLVAEMRYARVVIDVCQLWAPHDYHGESGLQADADRCTKTRTPVLNRTERSFRPVLGRDHPAHGTADREKHLDVPAVRATHMGRGDRAGSFPDAVRTSGLRRVRWSMRALRRSYPLSFLVRRPCGRTTPRYVEGPSSVPRWWGRSLRSGWAGLSPAGYQ